jgi:type I restriction enzyme M protein
MKLHEAIEAVLRKKDSELHIEEIVDLINTSELYVKKDGNSIEPSQVRLRVKNYPNLFSFNNEIVSLINDNITSQLLFLARKLKETLWYNSGTKDRNELIILTWFLYIRSNTNEPFYSRSIVFNTEEIVNEIDIFLIQKEFTIEERKHIVSISNKLNDDLFKTIIHLTADYYPGNNSISDIQFANFYETLLVDINLHDNRQIFIPKTLVGLIAFFFKTNSISGSFFDPFANSFSVLPNLLFKIGKEDGIILNTNNITSQILIRLNLIAHGFSNYKINLNDFWNNKNDIQYDNIITIPPIGLNLKNFRHDFDYNYNKYKYGFSSKSETMALQIILNSMSQQGKALVLIPENMLVSSDKVTLTLRKVLLEEDKLEAVISLPNDLFHPFSGLKTSLLVINNHKAKDNLDQVKFYSVDSANLNSHNYNLQSLNSSLIEINNNDIINNNYKLNYHSQLPRLIAKTSEKYVKLGEVLQNISKGINIKKQDLNEHLGIPYINIKDLQTDSASPIFQVENVKTFIEDIEDFQTNKYPKLNNELKKGTILLAKNGNALKACMVDKNIHAFYSNNVLAFWVKEEIALPGYILSQLKENYVIEQINSIRGGAVIPFLRTDNLLNVEVKLPSLSEQALIEREFFLKQFENIDRNFNSKLNSKSNIELIGSVKHEFGNLSRPLAEDLSLLKTFFKSKIRDHSTFKIDDTITPRPDSRKVFDVFESMQDKLLEMGNLLEDIQILINIEEAELKKTDYEISTLFNEIISEYGEIYFNLSIKHVKKIHINVDYFKKAIRNLIVNTFKHGFDGKPIENCISVEIDFDQTGNIVINFKNSGKPFDENFNFDKFISFGYKSGKNKGSGIGGYLINQIILKHGGEFKLIDKSNIHFQILIPIK